MWLAVHSYDPIYGARPVGRMVQREVLGPAALLLLSREGDAAHSMVLDCGTQSDGLRLLFQKKEGATAAG